MKCVTSSCCIRCKDGLHQKDFKSVGWTFVSPLKGCEFGHDKFKAFQAQFQQIFKGTKDKTRGSSDQRTLYIHYIGWIMCVLLSFLSFPVSVMPFVTEIEITVSEKTIAAKHWHFCPEIKSFPWASSRLVHIVIILT